MYRAPGAQFRLYDNVQKKEECRDPEYVVRSA